MPGGAFGQGDRGQGGFCHEGSLKAGVRPVNAGEPSAGGSLISSRRLFRRLRDRYGHYYRHWKAYADAVRASRPGV
jgi:hypothetical protein